MITRRKFTFIQVCLRRRIATHATSTHTLIVIVSCRKAYIKYHASRRAGRRRDRGASACRLLTFNFSQTYAAQVKLEDVEFTLLVCLSVAVALRFARIWRLWEVVGET
ncbi:hypothetical protein EVAR_25156_1 [Eumeta japonica]|uniref:Uncharacterized protein n=1 Tax=Eumeta variegata TaxID=151549 RepID=A0A4C1VQB3_EUMVA|nr:hypothetical protein EVAR_25156_1 [Eumeta japonica]